MPTPIEARRWTWSGLRMTMQTEQSSFAGDRAAGSGTPRSVGQPGRRRLISRRTFWGVTREGCDVAGGSGGGGIYCGGDIRPGRRDTRAAMSACRRRSNATSVEECQIQINCASRPCGRFSNVRAGWLVGRAGAGYCSRISEPDSGLANAAPVSGLQSRVPPGNPFAAGPPWPVAGPP